MNSKRIKKEESEEQIHLPKSVISENRMILDNKCPENLEILRGKVDLGGELKRFCEEKYIAVSHTKNLN